MTCVLTFAATAGIGLSVHAQAVPKAPAPPVTKSAVGAWDAAIVRRAAKILASPAQWSKADTGDCVAGAKTFSISCALDKANQEAAGISEGTAGISGEIGWRTDKAPREVWAGTMSDAVFPVMYEAEQLVKMRTTKKYDDPVVDYNNDPATTFADVQSFFAQLEGLVTKNGGADQDVFTEAIEIEIYDGGTGVIRTVHGWFPVVAYSAQNGTPRFQIDLKQEVPPNDLDRQIIQRSAALIASDAVWNRADNRKCPAGAPTLSIYCAVEQATVEVTGGFHHRRPAGELVRVIVEARSKDKNYAHRMMDYNNDPSTQLADVKSLFAEALARIK